MNNKRQTIWLVSMLSLMVILSAYYLFTEDVSPTQNAGAGTQQTETSGGAQIMPEDASQGGVQVTEEDPSKDAAPDAGTNGLPDQASPDAGTTGAQASPDTGKTGSEASGGQAVSPDDEAVLKEMANLKGAQLIDELQRRRQEKYGLENEKLNAIVADTKNHTQEQASSAVEEMARLEETDNRMTSLEEKLLQDFDNAVVTEEDLNFKVLVQAAKLEKKQAVRIIDLASKELNVTPDRLSVQYVP
jgi:stage III sporulation protein AH